MGLSSTASSLALDNVAPVLSNVPVDVTIPEEAAYSFTAMATDHDLPANTLTFSLVGAPAGASINGSSGLFTWTPTEAQGPGDYTFNVVVSDGSLTDTNTITAPADRVGLPLQTIQINESIVRETYGRPFVLVRPDGHIAWRGEAIPNNASAMIDKVRGEI